MDRPWPPRSSASGAGRAAGMGAGGGREGRGDLDDPEPLRAAGELRLHLVAHPLPEEVDRERRAVAEDAVLRAAVPGAEDPVPHLVSILEVREAHPGSE